MKDEINSTSKGDLGRFTLSDTKNPLPEKPLNSEQLFGNLADFKKTNPGGFWRSMKGKLWLILFLVILSAAVIFPFIFLRAY